MASAISQSQGLVLIYDSEGVSSECTKGTFDLLRNLVDDRNYQVSYFSNAPHALNERDIRLFVIPGGNYRLMAPKLSDSAEKIREIVTHQGASYLGICAGAIAAASTELLVCYDPIDQSSTHESFRHYIFSPWIGFEYFTRLNLYSGRCAYLHVKNEKLSWTQVVNPAQPFDLFFNHGVFFPNARVLEGVHSVLDYANYHFHAIYNKKTYTEDSPAAAVFEKKGNGKVLLSGIHPEMTSDIVKNLSINSDSEEKCRAKAVVALNRSAQQQKETMISFLAQLEIKTK